MKVFEHELYKEDIKLVGNKNYPWEKLKDKTVLISGATGLLGSFLVDVIKYRNQNHQMNCKVYVVCRNAERAKERFGANNDLIDIISTDINLPLNDIKTDRIDYIIHMASNTHPADYANDPIGTVLTNVIGTKNMLDVACKYNAKRCLFCSSVEVYGENRGDVKIFDEQYCGYIDSNTLRAGYPESKRCGEALCQAYIKQKTLDIVIARIARVYGPTVLSGDTKAVSQFIAKGVSSQNIVLKSQGTQYYSYIYVADAVSGLLTVLFNGMNGEAYNIADNASDIMLKDLAELIADTVGTEVVFELPDETEIAGFSKATLARMDNAKIESIGWEANYNIEQGIKRTLSILKSMSED